jgi:hypothetical protein
MSQFTNIVIPSNPTEREAIKSSMKEISDVMTMIEAKRQFITDEIKALSEKYKLPARFLRKMARAYHSQTFQKEKQEMLDFEALYESIVGEK